MTDCKDDCGCFYLRLKDSTEIFQQVWPKELRESATWGICLSDQCYMHLKYIINKGKERILKKVKIKYILHIVNKQTGDMESVFIQSDICHLCGEVQKTTLFKTIPLVPFRFVGCIHLNSSY